MARLEDSDGRYFELTPLAYWKDDISVPPDVGRVVEEGISPEGYRWLKVIAAPDRWAANDLIVRMAASDGIRT